MDKLIVTLGADLEALSVDGLIELNQKLGRNIDDIREYRRQVKAAYSQKLAQVALVAKLTPAERAALGIKHVDVFPDALNIDTGVE